MEIDVEKRNGYVVITPICGQIDAGNYDELRKQIGSVLKTDHNILLNLENVQFLDSSAASVILYCYRNIQLHQGNFEICAPSIAVNVTLKLLKMDRLTKVFHSLEEAGRAFEDKINATQK
ncbi:MAG TPA: STAS domain-containing protein [Phycisphaerae bacterium]|nr:STAS domain-containing protein [Phycisphaerae bacterium]